MKPDKLLLPAFLLCLFLGSPGFYGFFVGRSAPAF